MQWTVATTEGTLEYTLELGGQLGHLTVKRMKNNNQDKWYWRVYHQGVRIVGYSELTDSIEYCNDFAKKLQQV